MSDGAIVAIVTGVVTIITSFIGFLTLWLKIKYGVERVQEGKQVTLDKVSEVADKLDNNTAITTEARTAAQEASNHAATCDEERAATSKILADHSNRIGNLESQMTALKVSVDAMGKNIDSTRHEMRGQLQSIVSKLDMMNLLHNQASTPSSKEQ